MVCFYLSLVVPRATKLSAVEALSDQRSKSTSLVTEVAIPWLLASTPITKATVVANKSIADCIGSCPEKRRTVRRLRACANIDVETTICTATANTLSKVGHRRTHGDIGLLVGRGIIPALPVELVAAYARVAGFGAPRARTILMAEVR